MAYVGNTPAAAYTSIAKQDITGDGGTGYTLDHAVANENEIEVFVNNVRQEPSVAYTVSGTALTMTGNVAASDDFYVVFQGKALQTVTPPSSSVTTDMIVDDAVTADKIADDAVDTAQIADDAVTTAKTDFYESGTWTPYFGAVTGPTYNSQTGTYVKIGNVVYCEGIIDVASGLSNTDTSGIHIAGLPYSKDNDTELTCLFTHNTSHSTLFDSSHDNVKGGYVTGTTLLITENNASSGTNLTYAELSRTSGKLYFACQYMI